LRRKPSFIISVKRRLADIRETAKLETQFYRRKLVLRLHSIFNLATSIAIGETKQLRVGGKFECISAKERQMWAHVAAHVAEVIGKLSSSYDEKDFKEDLIELERQIDEIRQAQLRRNKEGDHPIATSPADANSGAAEPNHS